MNEIILGGKTPTQRNVGLGDASVGEDIERMRLRERVVRWLTRRSNAPERKQGTRECARRIRQLQRGQIR